MKKLFLFTFFHVLSCQVWSQIKSDTLNKHNDKRQRHGYWVVYLTKQLTPTTDTSKAFFYGFNYYDNGHLVGYFNIGNVYKKEATYVTYEDSMQPRKGKIKLLNWHFIFHDRDSISMEETYKNGIPIIRKSYVWDADKRCKYLQILDYTNEYEEEIASYEYEYYYYDELIEKMRFRNKAKTWGYHYEIKKDKEVKEHRIYKYEIFLDKEVAMHKGIGGNKRRPHIHWMSRKSSGESHYLFGLPFPTSEVSISKDQKVLSGAFLPIQFIHFREPIRIDDPLPRYGIGLSTGIGGGSIIKGHDTTNVVFSNIRFMNYYAVIDRPYFQLFLISGTGPNLFYKKNNPETYLGEDIGFGILLDKIGSWNFFYKIPLVGYPNYETIKKYTLFGVSFTMYFPWY